MRQVWITKTGGPEVLEVREAPDPTPGDGEVRVRVKAAGINFADILARKGLYPDAPKLPAVVGYEIAGDIDEVGEGVDPGLIGKAVGAATRFGGYSDTVVLDAARIFPKPQSLSYEQTAAIPVNYVTAYQLMIVMGALQQGESVLIHNVGGGVGLAALDIAEKHGATTYGTSSPNKHKFLLERGLDHPIDYRHHDWEKILDELTEGKGVELIIDPIGGESWKKSYRALRSTGRLGMYGVSDLSQPGGRSILKLLKFILTLPKYNPIKLMNGNKGVFGVNLGHMTHETDKVRMWMFQILMGVEEGWVRPHVDSVFPFTEAGEAHQYIEDRKNIGKVILAP